jgi:hypothetical protein
MAKEEDRRAGAKARHDGSPFREMSRASMKIQTSVWIIDVSWMLSLLLLVHCNAQEAW